MKTYLVVTHLGLLADQLLWNANQTSEIKDLADVLRSSFFLLANILLSANFLISDTMNIEDVSPTRNSKSRRNIVKLLNNYFMVSISHQMLTFSHQDKISQFRTKPFFIVTISHQNNNDFASEQYPFCTKIVSISNNFAPDLVRKR